MSRYAAAFFGREVPAGLTGEHPNRLLSPKLSICLDLRDVGLGTAGLEALDLEPRSSRLSHLCHHTKFLQWSFVGIFASWDESVGRGRVP